MAIVFKTKIQNVFGRFSVRGAKQHHQNYIGKTNLTLVLFWPLTYLPTQGDPRLFWFIAFSGVS
jgi:hypothetical protein